MKRLLLVAALTACAGVQSGPMPEGQRTSLATCTSCHRAYEPARYTPEQWSAAIDKMEALKKTHLTQQERAEIMTYLTGRPIAAK